MDLPPLVTRTIVFHGTMGSGDPARAFFVGAVVYLVREIKTLRDRTEAEAARRETALVEALRKNEEAMHELKAATIEQTGWFKTVAQNVINRDINPHLP